MRLGHAERSNSLAAHHPRQPLLLLSLGAEGKDISGDKIGMDEKSRPAGPHPPEFFENDHIEQIIESKPAIFFGNRTAKQALRAGVEPQLPRDNAVLLPLGVEWNDLPLDKAADRLPEYIVFLA